VLLFCILIPSGILVVVLDLHRRDSLGTSSLKIFRYSIAAIAVTVFSIIDVTFARNGWEQSCRALYRNVLVNMLTYYTKY
jgi:hypothetical protein